MSLSDFYQLLRKGLLACGSMVLSILVMLAFSLEERKSKHKRRKVPPWRWEAALVRVMHFDIERGRLNV